MARLHMATVDDIPDDKYRQYAPANPELFIPANSQPLVWWNTFLIRWGIILIDKSNIWRFLLASISFNWGAFLIWLLKVYFQFLA